MVWWATICDNAYCDALDYANDGGDHCLPSELWNLHLFLLDGGLFAMPFVSPHRWLRWLHWFQSRCNDGGTRIESRRQFYCNLLLCSALAFICFQFFGHTRLLALLPFFVSVVVIVHNGLISFILVSFWFHLGVILVLSLWFLFLLLCCAWCVHCFILAIWFLIPDNKNWKQVIITENLFFKIETDEFQTKFHISYFHRSDGSICELFFWDFGIRDVTLPTAMKCGTAEKKISGGCRQIN